MPKIGANVFIGPYAMILGDIKIGDNATIGAGTLVMKDAKRNEEKKKELLKAVENSTKTYEEIMAFICSESEIN